MKYNSPVFLLKKDVIGKENCFVLSFPFFFKWNYLSDLNICGTGTENQFSASSFSKQKISVTKCHCFLPPYHKSLQVSQQWTQWSTTRSNSDTVHVQTVTPMGWGSVPQTAAHFRGPLECRSVTHSVSWRLYGSSHGPLLGLDHSIELRKPIYLLNSTLIIMITA